MTAARAKKFRKLNLASGGARIFYFFLMADTHAFVMLQDITVTVVAATVAMRIFSMLKLPLLLGFIVAGILLSPVFGLIQNADTIVELGELGVMFMRFFVGMEFNMERLKKVFAPSFLG